MFDRIKCDATLQVSRVVAKMTSYVAVSGFMHRDGKQYRQRINSDGLNQIGDVHRSIVSEPQTKDSQLAPALTNHNRLAAIGHRR